ncbi:MAG: TPM domain-containing protein [Burkholderiales bacterium]
MHLNDQERDSLVQLVAQTENRTGAQVVTAVVGKADSYAEAPWKAFALGAALSALATLLWLPGDWEPAETAARTAAVILGSGAILALLVVLLQPFARLFIDPLRRETEVRQFAQSLFYSRDLAGTRGRTGLLILVSLIERRVTILADKGFDSRISPDDWHQIVQRMTPFLQRRRPAGALRTGIQALQVLLLERGFFGPGLLTDEIADTPLEMREGE